MSTTNNKIISFQNNFAADAKQIDPKDVLAAQKRIAENMKRHKRDHERKMVQSKKDAAELILNA